MFFSRTKFGTLQSAVTLSYALFSFLREIQTARTNMIFQRASNFVEQIRTLHLHIMQLKVYKERDRRCTYIVILSRFRVTIVAVEQQEVFHILSVCL